MRSFALTFFFALFALALSALVGWRLKHGNLDVLFGAPPTPIGQVLYPGFTVKDVKHISLSGNGVKGAEFYFDERRGWQASSPWKDRMDPFLALSIINFTLSTRVADVIPKDKITDKQAGFGEDVIVVRLEGAGGEPLCKYFLGRTTEWMSEDPTNHEEVPTVFIRTLDKTRKNYVYACTGDIHLAFRDGMRFLRDHQPFLCTPRQMERIHIRTTDGELTLGRASPDSPWRINKPLDLHTDIAAMRRLTEGLIKLRAVKVSNASDVTLPAKGAAAGAEEIGVHLFGMEDDVVLQILPPQTPDAPTRLATISDRPGTVFELPAKSDSASISLSSLPLKVNELRESTLTNLNPGSISRVLIQPLGRDDLVLTRQQSTPSQRGYWLMEQGPVRQVANDFRLADLLQAVTLGKISGFVTDAATDFSPWGLDRPFLKLVFQADEKQSLELDFGRDKSGIAYVNRRGTTSVMRVDGDVLARIATRAFEWRSSRLWGFSRSEAQGVNLNYRGKPLLELTYNDKQESWTAQRGGQDVSAELDTNRAYKLLGELEAINVNRWLSPDDEGATTALLNPSMIVTVRYWRVNADGDHSGTETRELRIAPAVGGASNRFYYGYLTSDPYPFTLDKDTVEKLATGLFADDY